MEQMNDDFNRQAGNHACEPEEALSCRISADGPIVFPGSEQSVDRSALSIFAFTIFDTGPLHLCTWAGPPPYRGPTPKPLKICEWPRYNSSFLRLGWRAGQNWTQLMLRFVTKNV